MIFNDLTHIRQYPATSCQYPTFIFRLFRSGYILKTLYSNQTVFIAPLSTYNFTDLKYNSSKYSLVSPNRMTSAQRTKLLHGPGLMCYDIHEHIICLTNAVAVSSNPVHVGFLSVSICMA